MSIDLSRPLVPAMGDHDPLDGFVTCVELRASAAKLRGSLEPAHRSERTWAEHRDINEVMLATCLVSEGFLALDGSTPSAPGVSG